jgi:hypothetical protein
MKKYRSLLLVVPVLMITYFIVDHHLFFYGRSDFDLFSPLPLKIKPEYSFYYARDFSLSDEFGFSIAGEGVGYELDKGGVMNIRELLKYGFNDEKLVAIVEDKGVGGYCIEFSADGHNEMNVRVYPNNRPLKVNLYKWIQIKGNERNIEKIQLLRNWLRFITLSLLIVVLFLIVSRSRNKSRSGLLHC